MVETNQWITVRIKSKAMKLLSDSRVPMNQFHQISSMRRTTKRFPMVELYIGNHVVEFVCINESVYSQIVVNAEMKINLEGSWIMQVDPLFTLNGVNIINAEYETIKSEKVYSCELCGGTEWKKEKGEFVCIKCGCIYPLEELREQDSEKDDRVVIQKAVHRQYILSDCIEVMTQECVYAINTIFVQNNFCYLFEQIDDAFIKIDVESANYQKGLRYELVANECEYISKKMVSWELVKMIIVCLQYMNKEDICDLEKEMNGRIDKISSRLMNYDIEMKWKNGRLYFYYLGKTISFEKAINLTCDYNDVLIYS